MLRAHLIHVFKHLFLVFKQYYTYFTHFFTHTYFQKIQITLLEQYYQPGIKCLQSSTREELAKLALLVLVNISTQLPPQGSFLQDK